MTELRALCVYCGSSDLVDQKYLDVAQQMGQEISARGLTLVFGGGSTGLMGAAADAALNDGGKVHGVITKQFNQPNIAHSGLSRLEVVEDMHQRKARMMELADAFVALPGGFGTREELFEV